MKKKPSEKSIDYYVENMNRMLMKIWAKRFREEYQKGLELDEQFQQSRRK